MKTIRDGIEKHFVILQMFDFRRDQYVTDLKTAPEKYHLTKKILVQNLETATFLKLKPHYSATMQMKRISILKFKRAKSENSYSSFVIHSITMYFFLEHDLKRVSKNIGINPDPPISHHIL